MGPSMCIWIRRSSTTEVKAAMCRLQVTEKAKTWIYFIFLITHVVLFCFVFFHLKEVPLGAAFSPLVLYARRRWDVMLGMRAGTLTNNLCEMPYCASIDYSLH